MKRSKKQLNAISRYYTTQKQNEWCNLRKNLQDKVDIYVYDVINIYYKQVGYKLNLFKEYKHGKISKKDIYKRIDRIIKKDRKEDLEYDYDYVKNR